MTNEQLANLIISNRKTITEIEEAIKIKREEFELLIQPEKEALLESLTNKEEFEKNLIESMKNESIQTIKLDNASITCSSRNTLKLGDEKELQDYILLNASKLKEYVKDSIKTKDELIEKIMPRKISITSVKFLSDRYYDIVGETLPGIVKSETNYLTIKNI